MRYFILLILMSKDFVVESLELVAERSGDITPLIYKRYFERCPDSEVVISHLDEVTMGKMMDEVYRLLMVSDYVTESEYLNWEIANHESAYDVQPHMHNELFTAILEVVREALGLDWNTVIADAWETRCDNLQHEIF